MNIKNGVAGPRSQYDLAFRRKICEELSLGGITITEIKRKYDISNRSAIYTWLKWYAKEQNEIALPGMDNDMSPKEDDSDSISQSQIEKELQLAKLKIVTLETMIEIAEKEFKIAIRKKSGTKPSIE